MNLKVGDRVVHPTRLDWGPGEIIDADNGKLTVYFALVGEKILKGVALILVTGDDAWHPLLEHRIRSRLRGKKTRSISEYQQTFLRRYPLGFSDPQYLKDERNYKVDASRDLHSTLNRATAAKLIEA